MNYVRSRGLALLFVILLYFTVSDSPLRAHVDETETDYIYPNQFSRVVGLINIGIIALWYCQTMYEYAQNHQPINTIH